MRYLVNVTGCSSSAAAVPSQLFVLNRCHKGRESSSFNNRRKHRKKTDAAAKGLATKVAALTAAVAGAPLAAVPGKGHQNAKAKQTIQKLVNGHKDTETQDCSSDISNVATYERKMSRQHKPKESLATRSGAQQWQRHMAIYKSSNCSLCSAICSSMCNTSCGSTSSSSSYQRLREWCDSVGALVAFWLDMHKFEFSYAIKFTRTFPVHSTVIFCFSFQALKISAVATAGAATKAAGSVRRAIVSAAENARADALLSVEAAAGAPAWKNYEIFVGERDIVAAHRTIDGFT